VFERWEAAVAHHGFESYFVEGEGLLAEAGEGRALPALADDGPAGAPPPPFRFSRMGPSGRGKQLGEPNARRVASRTWGSSSTMT
jgi:hypothetical protein